jgi:cob(I)alamin adenosyltransferase
MGDTGRILIITGNGKGKTTAALGMVLRAHGHGIPVRVIQFVKSDRETGEFAVLTRLDIEIIVTGLGFVPRPTDPRFADHCRAAQEGLGIAAEATRSGRYGMVVLDEICTAVALQLLPEESVLRVLRDAAPGCILVLTGRGATERLVGAADTVSEIHSVKHGFDQGRKAQKGVEF